MRGLLLSAVCLFAGGAFADDEPTPQQRYHEGKRFFDFGECTQAIDSLSPLAVPGKLQDEREQLDVHRMLGICYALADKEDDAKREFSSLVLIDPDFTPDPSLTPPKAVEIFEKQRDAMKVRLDELKRARDRAKAAEVDAHGGVLLERTTVVRELPFVTTLMPFGLAQAANGETVKAVILGGVQGACAASTVALYWASILLQKDAQSDQSKANTYNGVVVGQLISAMGFVLSYGYGVSDALWNREDLAVIDKKQTRRPLTLEEIKALKKIEPVPPPAP